MGGLARRRWGRGGSFWAASSRPTGSFRQPKTKPAPPCEGWRIFDRHNGEFSTGIDRTAASTFNYEGDTVELLDHPRPCRWSRVGSACSTGAVWCCGTTGSRNRTSTLGGPDPHHAPRAASATCQGRADSMQSRSESRLCGEDPSNAPIDFKALSCRECHEPRKSG
jgi:hypothetical protein